MEQSDYNLKFAESLGRIEAKLDTIPGAINARIEALDGEKGRITVLEKDRTRNWWVTIAIAPVLSAVHATLKHFGINF